MPARPRHTLVLLLILLVGGCGGSDGPTGTDEPDPLEIDGFTAAPAEVAYGAPSTLSWTTRGAESCSIDPGVGSVPCTGTIEVTVETPTTFRLTARSGQQSRTAEASVSLVAPELDAITPDEGLPGSAQEITLTGSGFVPDLSQVSIEGDGVTVTAPIEGDAERIIVVFDVAAEASPGPRLVRVATPAGTTEAVSFTVLPLPAPVLQTVSPAAGNLGSTVTVTLEGSGFLEGATAVEVSGEGVVVGEPTVTDGAELTVDLVISAEAEPGARELTAVTPGGTSNAVSFTVVDPPAILDLAVGVQHTCAVRGVDGSTWCFGSGTSGGLGGGVFEHSADPVEVLGDHRFERIFAGLGTTCGLEASGKAWCWGDLLGDGTLNNSAEPVAVAGELAFTEISLGLLHACGITTDGAAWCWGFNGSGRLGDGTTESRRSPARVTGGHTFVSIATSPAGAYSCGVRSDGRAMCWGSGALGSGTDVNTQSSVPVAVVGDHDFASIAIGKTSTCAITTDGAAWCWGSGGEGRLGNGSSASSPTPVAVSGGLTFTDITGTGSGSFCALATDEGVYCWGSGEWYYLGNGSLADRSVPTPVSGDQAFTSVSGPGFHACAQSADGSAWCWGANGWGQLGDGGTASRTEPHEVTAGPFGGG